MKATLKNYRQPPRKVRLVTREVLGKQVPQALALLQVIDKKISEPISKLIRSAVTNAGKRAEDMVVRSVIVNQGIVMKRYRPRAFGRATPNVRRTSTVHVTLEEQKTV
ncbi:MAG: 50S ribosomal protein L22 [Candidatus Kaiserbacteria bacterium]|nr:50S ribosomal protein L22 [Candidatus Kaiserbacteria bacterium]